MTDYRIALDWQNAGTDLAYETFNRQHRIEFGGGQAVEASSAAEYLGDAARVNPEESLAAALASCHLLSFLAICAKKRVVVKRYRDQAIAVLGKNAEGKMCVTRITLQPQAEFAGDLTTEQIAELHQKAHQICFIANSIRCEVSIEPANDIF